MQARYGRWARYRGDIGEIDAAAALIRVGVGVGVRVRVRARARAAATSVSRFCSLRLGEIQARYREVYLAPPSRASAACG